MSERVREAARAPAHSFLVQAPAGSGKTELLTQRILALLAIVDEPEEILALTFTRKAAAEMRARVIDSLRMPEPDTREAHKHRTWRLARAAMAHAERRGWRLLEQPARLRMMTLDSFMYGLARQLPLLSGWGMLPRPSEHAEGLYREAAEEAIELGWRECPEAVQALLLHQDHDVPRLMAMLADLLGRREQWLPVVAEHARDMAALRARLERDLRMIIEGELERCAALLPMALGERLLPLARFAAAHGGDPALAAITSCPGVQARDLAAWRALGGLLFTQDGAWRQRVDKRLGFPPGKEYGEAKRAMLALLQELGGIAGLREAWLRLYKLPATHAIEDEQWRMLQHLFKLLILAQSCLQTCFMRRNEADFSEIALRALEALGRADRPADLLLRLDMRIRHILVDEFQDTSLLQMELLRRLTAGWQQGDGMARSLFLVGDPMQSIYRFRKAEVGLFLSAARNEQSLPALRHVRLERNFRSSPVIVDWVNRAFAAIFPAESDIVMGGVAHARAEAACAVDGEVHAHLQHARDDVREAACVVDLVRQALARGEGCRVGILAFTRKHLHSIMTALVHAEIPFRAVDILPLAEQPEIMLARALILALQHPYDRVAWAALLRAPCCGLDTRDLHALLAGDDGTVWQRMEAIPDEVSEDARARLQFLRAALAPCLDAVGSIPMHRLLAQAWRRLHLDRMFSAEAQRNVRTLLGLVKAVERQGRVSSGELDTRLARLYAEPSATPEASRVELLTAHGAKGLEWDVVILPGLGRKPSRNDNPLFVASEVPLPDGSVAPLLAMRPPVRASDSLYRFVCEVEKIKDHHELQRTLYVACTRARRQLHLLGHMSDKGEAEKGSPLRLLLDADPGLFGATLHQLEGASQRDAQTPAPILRMATVPPLPAQPDEELTDVPEYVWAGVEAAPIGNAMHRALQYLGEIGFEHWDEDAMHVLDRLVTRSLLGSGLSGELADEARRRCLTGLARVRESSHARWILSARHRDARQEWALGQWKNGRAVQGVIDRSFIDEQGVRWIIDYKTAEHEGGGVEAFLAEEEQRHLPQLARYAALVRALEPERVLRVALYFPMLDRFREVRLDDQAPFVK